MDYNLEEKINKDLDGPAEQIIDIIRDYTAQDQKTILNIVKQKFYDIYSQQCKEAEQNLLDAQVKLEVFK